jgi:alpha 1,3-mannosyltransferase
MLDIMTVLTDKFMNLKHGTWASKPFAALAAPYEQVLLLDSDAVSVRSRRDLMDQAKAQGVHTFLFQDRRLEQIQNSTRQQFIREQVQRAGIPETCCETMLGEAWIDLEDSGAVLVNKKDLKALVGLLHTCWQNSAAVRDKVTYKVFYGDKETFWLGMALTGAPFTFEKHHSGIVGILQDRTDGNGNSKTHVCGNTIAH